MNKRKRSCKSFVNLSAFVLIFGFSSASASEENVLVKILTPANVVLMLGNVCTANDPSFLDATRSERGTFQNFAQDVKNRVSKGLGPDSLLVVLRRAADQAKLIALSELRSTYHQDPEVEKLNLRNWCDTKVKYVISSTIEEYYSLEHSPK